jgi:hypothetical protein
VNHVNYQQILADNALSIMSSILVSSAIANSKKSYQTTCQETYSSFQNCQLTLSTEMRNQKDFAALHLQEIQQLDDFNYS